MKTNMIMAAMLLSPTLVVADLSSISGTYAEPDIKAYGTLISINPDIMQFSRLEFARGVETNPGIKSAVFIGASTEAATFKVMGKDNFFPTTEQATIFATTACAVTNNIPVGDMPALPLNVAYVYAANENAESNVSTLLACQTIVENAKKSGN